MVYNLKLEASELQIVANAISQRPYAEVAVLLANLQQQVTEQDDLAKSEDK